MERMASLLSTTWPSAFKNAIPNGEPSQAESRRLRSSARWCADVATLVSSVATRRELSAALAERHERLFHAARSYSALALRVRFRELRAARPLERAVGEHGQRLPQPVVAPRARRAREELAAGDQPHERGVGPAQEVLRLRAADAGGCVSLVAEPRAEPELDGGVRRPDHGRAGHAR